MNIFIFSPFFVRTSPGFVLFLIFFLSSFRNVFWKNYNKIITFLKRKRLKYNNKKLSFLAVHVEQEIYRPRTAISNASNLCTAVGGDQNKEFRGKTSICGREDNKI